MASMATLLSGNKKSQAKAPEKQPSNSGGDAGDDDPRSLRERLAECNAQVRDLESRVNQLLADGKDILAQTWRSKKDKAGLIEAKFPRGRNGMQIRRNLKGHFGKIYALCWTPDNKELVSASQDGKIIVWNPHTTNKRVAIPLRQGWVMTVHVAPSGGFIASGGLDNVVSIFRITPESMGWETRNAVTEMISHEGYISCARFIDDAAILSASGDSTIMLWDIEYSQPNRVFSDHTGDVMTVDLTQEKHQFVSGSTDGTVKIWDMRTNSCTATFKGHKSDVNVTKWFPNMLTVASGSDDSSIKLWDVGTRRQVNYYQTDDLVANITDLDFSKSGNMLFAAYDEEPFTMAWNTMSGCRLFNLEHNVRTPCLQVSPDGYALATGSWDYVLRVWA